MFIRLYLYPTWRRQNGVYPEQDAGPDPLDALPVADLGNDPDALLTRDVGDMNDGNFGAEDLGRPVDDAWVDPMGDASVTPIDVGHNAAQDMGGTTSDAGDEGVPDMLDAETAPIEDVEPPPMPDAAPPVPDIDVPPMEQDMGPDDEFGPGRCNWGGWFRERPVTLVDKTRTPHVRFSLVDTRTSRSGASISPIGIAWRCARKARSCCVLRIFLTERM